MKPQFWIEKWQAGQIGFHQSEVHSFLVEFFPKMALGGKVLVPLCGKSLDMVWLAQQGCQVVGVELSSLACEAFFAENFPAAVVQRENRGEFVVYQYGPYTLYC
jgi:thiopurine S-methyltransferase